MLKVSIIIPSYMQGIYIERTILSIIDQQYTNLELIIIDGGSSDSTISVIKKYERYITSWVSEKDNGQAHAINKGLALASGDIVGWLNSDDKHLPHTLADVVRTFDDKNVMWVTGDCEVINEHEKIVNYYKADLPKSAFQWLSLFVLGHSISFIQPSTFWRKQVLENVGVLSENFHFSFDHEFFFRIFKKYGSPVLLSKPLSQFRLHSESKTVAQESKFLKENRAIGFKHSKGESVKGKLYLYCIYLRKILKNG